MAATSPYRTHLQLLQLMVVSVHAGNDCSFNSQLTLGRVTVWSGDHVEMFRASGTA
jgi:hypothetical protein